MNPQLENKTTVTRPFDVCQRVKFIYVTTITKHVITTNRCIDPSRWNHWYMQWSFSLEPLIHALILLAGTRYMHWSFSLEPQIHALILFAGTTDTCTDPSRWHQIHALILLAGTRYMHWSLSLVPDACTDPSHWHQIHVLILLTDTRYMRWDETGVAGDTDGTRL